MRKIRIKDDILEIITERYLTPVQYSAFEKYPDRICKMMDAQSNETTLVKIGVVTTEDTSKILTVTFAVKFPSSSENSFVNLSEVEQKLENFTEDVIGTINSWIEDEKVQDEETQFGEYYDKLRAVISEVRNMKNVGICVILAHDKEDKVDTKVFSNIDPGFAIMNILKRIK